MPKEETITTGFRIPKSLYWAFKHKAVERQVNDTEALRLAIREWINKDASSALPGGQALDSPSSLPQADMQENPVAPKNKSEYPGKDPEIQKWVGKLVQVLESRHSAAIRVVLTTLVAFSRFSAVDQEGSDSADSTIQAENEDIARAISNLRRATERAKRSPEGHKERGAKTA
ncbi:MAG TPA: hypothetical protein VIY49_19080 [Bryobacteraceae bacterium]